MTRGFTAAVAAFACCAVACSGAPTVDPPDAVPPSPEDAGWTPPVQPPPHPNLVTLPDDLLNVGYVPLFASDSPPLIKAVALVNAGDLPLRIDRIELRAVGSGSSLDEIAIVGGTSWLPATLPPKAIENFRSVQISIAPRSEGNKAWEMVIASDDPDEPEHVISIVALVGPPLPCLLSISPWIIEFGSVPAGEERTASLQIENSGLRDGRGRCILENVELAEGTSPEFSLPGGAIPRRILEPGQRISVPVRASWTGTLGPKDGALQFGTANSPGSVASVQVRVEFYVPECLQLAPDLLDYGTVQTGCGYLTQTAAMYSLCSTSVKVTSIGLQLPGKPSAGTCLTDPDCEFLLTASPAIPAGGLLITGGTAPTTLQVKYRPLDVGADVGVLRIVGEFGGAAMTWTIDLAGSGTGRTDTFTQEAAPLSSFSLSTTPNLAGGAIRVSVDGVLVAPTTWSYDSATNSIVFGAGFVPGAGQTISISYPIPCTP